VTRRLRAVLVTAVLAASLPLIAACGDSGGTARPEIAAADDAATADYEYVIPLGTGARIDAGEAVEILPAVLEVKVGETLRIVNHDTRGHVVGAFYVAKGETLTQRFASPGELSGQCDVHPSGSFTLRVLA
jgi:plastocyanin